MEPSTTSLAISPILDEPGHNFVYKTWMDSWEHSVWTGMIPRDDVRAVYRPYIELAIERLKHRGQLVLLHHPTIETEYYGWVAMDPKLQCVHYGYVNKIYRRKGIFRQGVESFGQGFDGLCYSFRTFPSTAIAKKHGWRYRRAFGRQLLRK